MTNPNRFIQPVALDPSWPQEFKDAHVYDRLEIWGEKFNAPYALYYSHRRERTLAALNDFCPPPARVLDLAAAGGNFSIAAAQMGYRVTWNDLRAQMADYVRLKVPDGVHLDFIAGNIFDLGDEMLESFDVVLALEVIEHVAHPDEFLAKLATLVRPGGIVITSTPNGAYFRNTLPRFSDFEDPSVFESVQFKPNSDGHIFLLYEDEMRSFADKAGLTLVCYEQFTNPLSAGHVKLRHLHKVLPESLISGIEMVSRRLPARLRAAIHCASVAVYRK